MIVLKIALCVSLATLIYNSEEFIWKLFFLYVQASQELFVIFHRGVVFGCSTRNWVIPISNVFLGR